MKKSGSASDPLWYKDAIIYELHVRAFADSNKDGIGDFPGLMSRLDYLQDLGVTCIWLLPFFPSPGRDDGYDIADYVDVNPVYGTLNDFKLFLDAAHERGMQVMIELVINHTSDQHPWFKAARMAPAGSPERAMYVWSETDRLYEGVRIIFTDTEKSNWTWDEQAKAFYWHRFFAHQPDLNFDNPRVMEEVLKAMRFWLDMGVDALRLDAIPYLIERDGTSCENVPETHVKIKQIRAALESEYSNRLILAEANMWPADVRPYFGDGDECHMAFHFPLMPRIYMALRQEDRLPITDIMAQTPEIPEVCQWGIFLRNHDELTLEMVTDDERDYMYLAYSADPRMRINVGIRRRLAPLVDNNRRRIELLNSLLLSFPGTPIMYYGDEIGMGDNIYLGDRNGVRTPMQWNSDRNAGFSQCDPARLYFPVIMDPTYGYQVVNVEAQLSDQSSLLHWTRNMIALRKLFQVFGRGTLRFLHPENRKILAYLREFTYEDGAEEKVLCVANLSRFAQPVSLDLSDFAGMMPVEMLGYVSFPQVGTEPYPLSIAPYSFLWFELQPKPVYSEEPVMQPMEGVGESEQVALDLLTKGWAGLFSGQGRQMLEKSLPAWLVRQRWFGAKSRPLAAVHVVQWAQLQAGTAGILPAAAVPSASSLGDALLFLQVDYVDGGTDRYGMPLSYSTGNLAEELRRSAPASILLNLQTPAGQAVLHDGAVREELRQSMLGLIADAATTPIHSVDRAAEEIATTVLAAHTGRPAHEIAAESPEIDEIAHRIERTHRIEPLMAAPQFAGHLPGSSEMTTGTVLGAEHATPPARSAYLHGEHGTRFVALRGTGALAARTGTVEQSNTNFLYGDRLLMKFFRRLQPGENPDVEIGRFLTDVAKFPRIAPFLGEVRAMSSDGETTTLAMLQGLVANQGDGWAWTLEELARFYEAVATSPAPSDPGLTPSYSTQGAIPAEAVERAGPYLAAAALLGRRTAEMHLALATPTGDPAFAAEPLTSDDLRADARQIDAQINLTLDALKGGLAGLKDLTADDAATILSRRIELFARAHAIAGEAPEESAGKRIRIHGDYHLGQILRADGDFVLLDFEGEPARTLEERRRKQCPLRDVAGMLRSFSYASWSGLDAYVQGHPERMRALEPWARLWERSVATEFLREYRLTMEKMPDLLPDAAQADTLLNAYLLEKALYELLYELNNRPAWVQIPLAGILSLPSEQA